MKVGDKIKCIKSYKVGNQEIKINNIYTIQRFDSMGINHVIGRNIDCVVITQNNVQNGDWFFSLEEFNNYFYFNEYFINIRENRKLKLERINEKFYSEG